MISSKMNQLGAALFTAVLGLAAASSAQAANSWGLASSGCTGSAVATGTTATWGNSVTCAGTTTASQTVTAYAWGATTIAGSPNLGYQLAGVRQYGGGLGVASQYEGWGAGQPEHTMDNNPVAPTVPDIIVLKFSTAIALDKITLGWEQGDSDITVMAYTGALTGTTDAAKMDALIKGKNGTAADANLLTKGGVGSGWALVENSGINGTNPGTPSGGGTTNDVRTVNSANVTSSWWIISAYNSGFGGGSLDSLTDYVKLLTVSSKDLTTPGGKAPEPGSLALAGVALLGMIGARRKLNKQNA
nr:exosortase-dependent surface protein XDP1 [uncultured Roseateles sp.]